MHERVIELRDASIGIHTLRTMRSPTRCTRGQSCVYVPDFPADSGATIRGAWENLRGSPDTDKEIAAIRPRTAGLLREARARGGLPPLALASR